MRLYLLITFLCVSAVCCAQKKHNVYFLKNDGRYLDTRDSSDYMRIVEEPDSGSTLYNVFEFYRDGHKKLAGKSSKIDPPVYEEQRITYYQNGNKQSIANYRNGAVIDDEFLFYPNGKVYLINRYPPNSSPHTVVDASSIMACYDSTGTALATNGNGAYKIYDDKFKIVESGNVKDGKRDGQCTGEENGGKWKYVELYENGALVRGTMTDETGAVSTYSKNRRTDPQYPGGLTAFYKYLSKKIEYPDKDRDNNITGVVVLRFIVEKDGKVTEIKIMNHVSPTIDAEAVRVMRASPLWLPGTVCGRPAEVYYSIPIAFRLQ